MLFRSKPTSPLDATNGEVSGANSSSLISFPTNSSGAGMGVSSSGLSGAPLEDDVKGDTKDTSYLFRIYN